jgi:hypothetical protein
MTLADDQLKTASRQRYRWPWFVLGAVVLGALLYVLWMTREIEHARRIRDANAPLYQTNRSHKTGAQ